MTLNLVYQSTVPSGPYVNELACIPVNIIPQVLGALRLKAGKYWYASTEDWSRGYSLLAQFSGELLMPCGREITNAVDRLYVLLDASLNGHDRSVTGTGTDLDPYVYDPPLSQEGEPFSYEVPGLRSHVKSTYNLTNNLVTGASSPDASGDAVPNARLQAIIDLLANMNGGDGPTFEQVAQILALLA